MEEEVRKARFEVDREKKETQAKIRSLKSKLDEAQVSADDKVEKLQRDHEKVRGP